MSKAISFGFNKQKPKPNASSSAVPDTADEISKTSTISAISIPKFKVAAPQKRVSHGLPKARTALSAINDDQDHDEDEAPKLEAVTGFSTDGAILSQPVQEKVDLVIENSGNQDWRHNSKNRRKGRDLLPEEVRAARNGQDVVMVEKDTVSTASGLQFASASDTTMDDATNTTANSNATTNVNGTSTPTAALMVHKDQKMIDDEAALAALLSDNPNAPRSDAIIEIGGNTHNETDDFRADVASRPDPSTLDEYAAMPVEEFGLAMLRGMGRKRRANGEVIAMPDFNEKKDKDVKVRKQEGFLGIGAKPVTGPGMDGVELGAWGKADMRKNAKGEGFFTPLMVRDTKTGEVVTEEEMERRKKAKTEGEREGEMEWKERRARNLEKYGREKDGVNGSSKRRDRERESARERERDGGSGSDSARSRSHKDRNGDDDGYDSGRSRRRRSRSRSKERRRKDESDDEGYDSRSSRKYKSDGRDRDRDRDRERDRDRDSHRDKYDDRSHRRDRDDRRHRDRSRDRDRDRR